MSQPVTVEARQPHPVRFVARRPSRPSAGTAGAPVIIDQRQLPGQLVDWRLSTVDAVVEAIRGLAVRGAPAIGITGAYGLVTGLLAAGDAVPADAPSTSSTAWQATIGAARPDGGQPRRGRARGCGPRRWRATVDAAAIVAAALAEAVAIHERGRGAACARSASTAALELRGAAADPDPLQHRPTGHGR